MSDSGGGGGIVVVVVVLVVEVSKLSNGTVTVRAVFAALECLVGLVKNNNRWACTVWRFQSVRRTRKEAVTADIVAAAARPAHKP